MRYDTPVYFRSAAEIYDAKTGDYVESIPTETLVYASVTSTSATTMHLVYGEIRPGSLTIQLQNHFDTPFSDVRIGEKIYRPSYIRLLKVKEVLVVTEAGDVFKG